MIVRARSLWQDQRLPSVEELSLFDFRFPVEFGK